MGFKIPIFNSVDATHLSALQKDLKNLVSVDSLMAILGTCFEKIKQGKELDNHELQLVLEWHSRVPASETTVVRQYINGNISRDPAKFAQIAEYFNGLRNPEVVGYLLSLPFIAERMSEGQLESFKVFLDGSIDPLVTDGGKAIAYIEDLYLIESSKFSLGQVNQARLFVASSNFAEQFEHRFEKLLSFLSQCGIDAPGAISKFLDQQLGRLIDSNEAVVTAKAFNANLGYLRFTKYVEKNASSLSVAGLPNYQKLLRLISRFEEAVSVLSEQEILRGSFWKTAIELVDGIKFHNERNSKYRVGVAFFVGEFVFCDFGPTGNKIHVYDKSTFINKIDSNKNWQVPNHLTLRLSDNCYSHVGQWRDKTKQLIKEARRNG